MNSNKKKITRQEAIRQVTEKALQIQNEGIATVFVYYMGHVNKVEVQVYFPHWIADTLPGLTIGFYCEETDFGTSPEEALEKLDEILNNADKYKNESELLEQKRKKERFELLKQLKEEFQEA